MSLYNNLITLLSKYFYKREEKPEKYKEWLISEYVNGVWYIGISHPIFKFESNHLYILSEEKDKYKIENNHLYVDKDSSENYKIKNNHLYYTRG